MAIQGVRLAEALRITGNVRLEYWGATNVIPKAGRDKYPIAYLQRLKEFSGDTLPTRERALLCTLEWWTQHGDDQRRLWVCDEVDALRKRKKIATTSEVVARLGYGKVVIRRWAKKRILPAVFVARRVRGRVADTYVFLWSDVLRMKAILDRLTAVEVAEQLEVTEGYVATLARQGRLVGTETHLGWRFTQEEVDRFAEAQRKDALSLAEAAKLVGITTKHFLSWVEQGCIVPVKDERGHGKYIREDVLSIKKQREMLRGGFEGLVASLRSPSYPPKLVAKKLDISTHTLTVWTRAGVLPYFDLGPPVLRQMQRQYLAGYVDGLVAYAEMHRQRLTRTLAENYKAWRMRLHS